MCYAGQISIKKPKLKLKICLLYTLTYTVAKVFFLEVITLLKKSELWSYVFRTRAFHLDDSGLLSRRQGLHHHVWPYQQRFICKYYQVRLKKLCYSLKGNFVRKGSLGGHSNNTWHSWGGGVTEQSHQISQGGGQPKCHVTILWKKNWYVLVFLTLNVASKHSFFTWHSVGGYRAM